VLVITTAVFRAARWNRLSRSAFETQTYWTYVQEHWHFAASREQGCGVKRKVVC